MQSKESFDKFYLSYKKRCGVKATIDKKEIEVFFKEFDDKINEFTDYKYMFCDYGQCKQGSSIRVNNSYYLATNKEENLNNNNLYEKFTVRKCQPIKFKNIVIYGLVDSKIFDITQTKYFDLVDNQILVQISSENRIKLDDNIIYNNKTYRIIAINDTAENSLILKCQYNKPTHTYQLKLNTSKIDIQEDQIYQIQVTPYIDNKIDEAAVVEYISLDTSICTVDNKGLITAIKQGVTTIKAKYQDIEEIININIVSKPQITYSIQGSDTVDNKAIQTYIIVDQNGNPAKEEFEFSYEKFDFNNPAMLVTIKDFTNNSILLIGGTRGTRGEFILKAVCKSDENIIIKKNIKVVKG